MTEEDFFNRYMTHLNQAQQEAVRTVDGAILLLAVPGSGKTTVLVTRLGYMVYVKGIDPSAILTATYTVAATHEMSQRFSALFGSEYTASMEFRTINGLSQKIIDYYTLNHGKRDRFRLISNEGEIKRQLGGIYQKITKEYPTASTIQEIRTAITYIKNMMIREDQIDSLDFAIPQLAEIYAQYNADLRSNRLMDFDDQMVYAHRILTRHPDVRQHFQEQYRFLCVDESQDTSKIQHAIIEILASHSGNLFMVGDEDQSIYGFRGAFPEALMRFGENYPQGKVLLIEQNYRSSQPIVAASNAFVRRNRFRHEKTMIATRDDAGPVWVIEAMDREAQYLYLFHVANSQSSETAVLFRNNDSALPLIDLLERAGVPYRCRINEETFFSHRVTADLMDILNFALDPCRADLFMKIYYKLNLMITREAAAQACQRSRANGRPVLENLKDSAQLSRFAGEEVANLLILLPMIAEANGARAVDYIRSSGYGQYVAKAGLDSGKIEIMKMLGKNQKNPLALLERLDQLEQIIRNQASGASGSLILSTIHSSKGLEYDQVYLLDVLDGILPANAFPDPDDAVAIQDYEEARRLHYVAMTRAKNQLHLFRCLQNESVFIREVQSALPQEVFEGDSLFAPYEKSMCGRTYIHKDRGRGQIRAQRGMTFLVEYEDTSSELRSLVQLYEDRRVNSASQRRPVRNPEDRPKVRGRQETTPPSRSSEGLSDSLKKGVKIRHDKFGTGVVVKKEGNTVSIRFTNSGRIRKFDVSLVSDHIRISP